MDRANALSICFYRLNADSATAQYGAALRLVQANCGRRDQHLKGYSERLFYSFSLYYERLFYSFKRKCGGKLRLLQRAGPWVCPFLHLIVNICSI